MRKQVIHISVCQTSKVIASMYTAMLFVFTLLPMATYHLYLGDIVGALATLIVGPFLYWVILYIGHLIGCWFYNLVAQRIGGIEVDLEEKGEGCCVVRKRPEGL